MPTPQNQHAAKPAGKHLEARTYVYSERIERVAWVRTASRLGKSLSEWLRALANKAADPLPPRADSPGAGLPGSDPAAGQPQRQTSGPDEPGTQTQKL